MLDELLGRAELKDRIADLEEENERLHKQLAAEEDRRAAAVSDRQDAQRRVNRLEDRIAELKDRVERLQTDEETVSFRGREDLRGTRLSGVLDRLDSVEAAPEGALTAMVDDAGAVPEAVARALDERVALVRRAVPCLVTVDDAGVVSAALRPPLPPEPFAEWDDAFRIDRGWFQPTGTFAFALVRSDLFALGEYDGDDPTTVEGFESDVMGRHSKGGFSQARFERRREEQVDAHLDRCRDALRDRTAEQLILVGEETVLDDLADLADRTATVDAGGDPETALASAFDEFWTTRLYLL